MASSSASPGSAEATQQMLLWLNGHCLEQALHVVAVLGIADLLEKGPRGLDELAEATETNPSALYRILRMLCGHGVFREVAGHRFGLAPLGETLRRDAPNSVRDRAIFYGMPEMWSVWGDLLHSVRTGQSAFRHRHATSFYDFLSRHETVALPFNRYMSKTSEHHNAAILESFDFAGLGTLVDVGGGQGRTLAAILAAYPRLKGVLFDLPEVVADATHLRAPEIASRSTAMGGDMEKGVPAGGDGYLIKWVLMDRPDELAVQVLRNCREAMLPDGRVIVVEMMMPEDEQPGFGKLMDVQMMLLFDGGRIRTESEFRALFDAAGLAVTAIHATRSPNVIIEGRPARAGIALGGDTGEDIAGSSGADQGRVKPVRSPG